ncbi:DUF6634 family protein [Thalassobaculum litoreum]|uniref:DUF6634 family protein n=1 Tax=Thalassobaculum litoreum TaxID=420996 RepID=UPI001587BE2F|nr:DUF6634 family protein [Thalassobaculum litoreum]
MIFLTARGVSPHIDRCERLLTDLKAIREGTGPSEAELATAPLIDQFSKVYAPVPCLTGFIHGHPGIPDGPGRTSDLWVVAPDQGCVRTLSRYYRLGQPKPSPRQGL